MRISSITTIFGVVAVLAAVAILFFGGGKTPTDQPMTLEEHGRRLFRVQGCSSCHAIGGGLSRGPDLAGLIPRLSIRLTTTAYSRHLDEIKQQRPDIYELFTEEYATILNAEGDERIHQWLLAHLRNPRFDHMRGTMPSFSHLTEQQTDQLIAFLFTLR